MNKLITLLMIIMFLSGWLCGYVASDSQIEQYEAGKKFARDSILNTNDSLLYTGIPDTISYKPELKNDGSYKIHGKGM
jgi:hypothetical protein